MRKIRKSYQAVQRQLDDASITYPMAYRLLEAYGFVRASKANGKHVRYSFPDVDNPDVTVTLRNESSGLVKGRDELDILRQAIDDAKACGAMFPEGIFPYTVKQLTQKLEQSATRQPKQDSLLVHPDSSTMFHLEKIRIKGSRENGLSWIGQWVYDRASRGYDTEFAYSDSHIAEWDRRSRKDTALSVFLAIWICRLAQACMNTPLM